MPLRKVRDPSGRIVEVEAPAGASNDEVIRLAQQQRRRERMGLGGIPVVPPGTPVMTPTVSGLLKKAFQERAGDIAAFTAGALMPGTGALGLASRVLGAEAAGEAGELATRGRTTPGLYGATQLGGETLAGLVRPLTSPVGLRSFAKDRARQIGDWLKRNVPAFRDFASDERGLYDIVHKTGQRELSQDFRAMLESLDPRIPRGQTVRLPLADAKALKVTPVQVHVIEIPTAATGPVPKIEEAEVDLRETVQKVLGRGATHPGLYRRTVDALTDTLDGLDLGPEWSQARNEYRIGAGWLEFGDKGKFLYGERYDPAKAQASLDRFGRSLMKRGMDELWGVIRGPGARPIEVSKHGPWSRRIFGATAAEVPAYLAGFHGYGLPAVAGGALGERLLPAETYRNVPVVTRLARFATRVSPALVGEAAREAARQTGITRSLPEVP